MKKIGRKEKNPQTKPIDKKWLTRGRQSTQKHSTIDNGSE